MLLDCTFGDESGDRKGFGKLLPPDASPFLGQVKEIYFLALGTFQRDKYYENFFYFYFFIASWIIFYSRQKKCQVGYGQRPFQYLSSQRPLRILDIFDQTAVEVWQRKKLVDEEKNYKKSLVTDDKGDMTGGILHCLAFFHPNICQASDHPEY